MKLGIVGLPNVGKSTLFNFLTKAGAESASYPFCAIDPSVGAVPVPDVRLDEPTVVYGSEEAAPAIIEFMDIAGLVKGTSKGRGLDNQLLSNICGVDAIAHIARCLGGPNVIHVDGSIDPIRNIETANLELTFPDIEISERHIAEQSKGAFNSRELTKEVELLKAIKAHLEDEKPTHSFEPDGNDAVEFVSALNLLTRRLIIFAANVTEDDLANDGADNQYVQTVHGFAGENSCEVFIICAKIKQGITEPDDDEEKMFLDGPGLTGSGLEKLVTVSYRILGLMSYPTAGPQKSCARTIKMSTKALQVAGKIHSDLERGFIRVEVINYDDSMAYGSINAAKEGDLVRSEGEECIMRDGGIVLFRFSV